MLENTKAGQYRPAPAHRTLERFKQHHAPASLRQPATRPQGKMITGPTQNSDKLLKGPTSKTSARSQTLERGYGRVGDRGRGGRGCAARGEAATAGAGTGRRRRARCPLSPTPRGSEHASLGRARRWRFLGAEEGNEIR